MRLPRNRCCRTAVTTGDFGTGDRATGRPGAGANSSMVLRLGPRPCLISPGNEVTFLFVWRSIGMAEKGHTCHGLPQGPGPEGVRQ